MEKEVKRVYDGTTKKVKIDPKATGFTKATSNWSVEVRYGSLDKFYKKYEKSDMVVDTNDNYIIVIDTTGMTGMVRAIVKADIPDEECVVTDGIRHEVLVLELFEMMKL